MSDHKASAEWYTPGYILDKVLRVFESEAVFDPCPTFREPGIDGLKEEWKERYIYINPPTPAKKWSEKALLTLHKNPDVSIIYAAFSESILWQLPELLDFPFVLCRKRIKWVDGNEYIKCKESDIEVVYETEKNGRKNHYKKNPHYLKVSENPSNYSAFVCLSYEPWITYNFCREFGDLGEPRISNLIQPKKSSFPKIEKNI
jgi:hypothetical protein